ncbi:type II toxin-antitoxin system HicB family antitoxin [Microcoleus sp. herbarium12]|uniref:type II toxin-antitoxin system HicB family antitoxin n=1 Tax=Microcoleus sp. herbarium12 TaxID=3055437 RepID=UPI002FD15EB2
MNTKILLKPSERLTNFSLTAVIEQETEGKYQAIVLGLPECQAEGNTRDEAIANLSQLVTNRLEKAELISLEIQNQKPDRPALTVLIEQETAGKYQAVVLGWEECKAEGNSREEVITNINLVVGDRLEKAELISLAIQPPKPEHPWMKFAGMYKDNPLFDEVLEDIQQLRCDRDAEMEEYYRKMDAEEAVK